MENIKNKVSEVYEMSKKIKKEKCSICEKIYDEYDLEDTQLWDKKTESYITLRICGECEYEIINEMGFYDACCNCGGSFIGCVDDGDDACYCFICAKKEGILLVDFFNDEITIEKLKSYL
jgi:hypothetical protein